VSLPRVLTVRISDSLHICRCSGAFAAITVPIVRHNPSVRPHSYRKLSPQNTDLRTRENSTLKSTDIYDTFWGDSSLNNCVDAYVIGKLVYSVFNTR
jgi:hypothetical protein